MAVETISALDGLAMSGSSACCIEKKFYMLAYTFSILKCFMIIASAAAPYIRVGNFKGFEGRVGSPRHLHAD